MHAERTAVGQPAHGQRLTARIALLGASGYSGQEFARLALAHPGLELSVLCSREHAGRPASELLTGLDPRLTSLPPVVDPSELEALLETRAFDTLVCCLPHGAWQSLAVERPALAQGPARIVDLSADFRGGQGATVTAGPASDGARTRAPAGAPAEAPAGARTRAPAGAPAEAPAGAPAGAPAEGGSGSGSGSHYVYGLPEAFRDEIPAAARIANPGCYPTAATLALLPAARWLAGPVMVSALSGVSGAGRSPALRTSFVELDGGAALYRAGTAHPHVPEMERNLARLGGTALPVVFAPQLVPMARGILLTASAALARPVSPEEMRASYLERYAGERFVRLLDPGAWPETRCVRGSNRCDLAVTTLHGGTTLLAAAAIDNLMKGAAGQAVQNLNLMLGWPEDCSLPVHGSPW